MAVLGHAVVSGEEVRRHVQLAQDKLTGLLVQHVGLAAMRPEYLGVRSRGLGHQAHHHVAFRAAEARKPHACKRAQILPRDRPRPDALDLVHQTLAMQKQRSGRTSRGIETRMGPRYAQKQTRKNRRQQQADPVVANANSTVCPTTSPIGAVRK